jgi:methylmalonyl-CoA mutase N-terminal domain/subunit
MSLIWITWRTSPIPGEALFTRGPYPSMYRGRTWTMRQSAGFGTPKKTNERIDLPS